MNKFSKAFENGKALVGFVTAGDPNLKTSEEIIIKMAEAGCDIIEIGIPFSDPIAEGPVVQEANLRALKQGTTTDKVFELAKNVSDKTNTPLLFRTYLNVLFKYGYDKFLNNAKNAGISGVVIPDLPLEEKEELASVAKNYNIDVISLVAPTTAARIKMIAEQADGFVYAVSSPNASSSKTITDSSIIVQTVREATSTPIAVDFDGYTIEQAKKLTDIADGIIIGSAIVKIIEKFGKNAPDEVCSFIKELKEAI